MVETTIHYPTDSSLLWDSWRVLARLLREGQTLLPRAHPHRFHDRKAKKLHLRITRYAGSPATSRRRLVKRCWRELIARVRGIVGVAEAFVAQSRCHPDPAVQAVAARIDRVLPSIRVVVSTAERANVKGETVPAAERVSAFSSRTRS